jgi:hypothetical protein
MNARTENSEVLKRVKEATETFKATQRGVTFETN